MEKPAGAVLVAYESLFGATRRIAEAVAEGAAESAPVDCRSIHEVDASDVAGRALLVLGAPTHGRSLPTAQTRAEGERWTEYRYRGRRLEPAATTDGMREWLARVPLTGLRVAVFTTRADLPWVLSGSATTDLARLARRAGGVPVARAFDARVDERGRLLDGELDRARAWGARLAARQT